jgi:hypothetical protein
MYGDVDDVLGDAVGEGKVDDVDDADDACEDNECDLN